MHVCCSSFLFVGKMLCPIIYYEGINVSSVKRLGYLQDLGASIIKGNGHSSRDDERMFIRIKMSIHHE